ncbi:MAG: hypothetical protein JXA42_16640 [Anaerolineales bacterium]|nr:hypothetical protein [Anaerolineales bacterium]
MNVSIACGGSVIKTAPPIPQTAGGLGGASQPVNEDIFYNHEIICYTFPLPEIEPVKITHASGLIRVCRHGLWLQMRMKEAEEYNK